jgi:DNA-binding transcriptional MerR regulator
MNMTDIGLSGDVARVLKVSRTRVRHLVLTRRLHPIARTPSGYLIFDMSDVERLEAKRRAALAVTKQPASTASK